MDDLILNTILGRPERVKIFRYFLAREDEKSNAETVRKFLKIAKTALFKKEIASLVKIGFLKKSDRKVWLNPYFPLNAALRQVVLFPSFWYKEKLADLFRKAGSVKLLALAGVLANDEKPVEAEIMIVGNRLKEKMAEKVIAQIEADLGLEINYLIMNEKDFHYRYSMFDRLVRGILDGKNEMPICKIDIGQLN